MKNKNVIIKKSKIDGANKGLFANQYFKKNQLIGQAHENGQPVGNIGHMHNHSDNPNMYSIKKGNKRFVFAKNNIQAGEELTTNYRLQPELEQPEDFRDGGEPCPKDEIWNGEKCVPEIQSLMLKKPYDQEPIINPAAYVNSYRGGNPKMYKYGFLNNEQGQIIGGGGFGFPKPGVHINALGVIPISSNDRNYFKGAYEAGISKDINQNLNIGLGVDTAITGYPGENGFVKDPIKFQPKLNLKYNLKNGGVINKFEGDGKTLSSVVNIDSTIINDISNAKTFNEAFKIARNAYGANHIFEWKDRKYGTNLVGEDFKPSEDVLAKAGLNTPSLKKNLNKQNSELNDPYVSKSTVKLEPDTYKSWNEIKQKNLELNMSANADKIINYKNNIRGDKNYIIVDKKKGLMHIYQPGNNTPLFTSPVDLGASIGDAQTVTKIKDTNGDGNIDSREAQVGEADFEKGNKSTGAGKYYISNIDPKGYGGLPLFNMMNESQYQNFLKTGKVDNVATSFHKGFVPNDNSRVSNGCIRCNKTTLDNLTKYLQNSSEVYILPEDPNNKFVIENDKLNLKIKNKSPYYTYKNNGKVYKKENGAWYAAPKTGEQFIKITQADRVKELNKNATNAGYNFYEDSKGNLQKGQGVNLGSTLNYIPIKAKLDKEKFVNDKFTYFDFSDNKELKVVNKFVSSLEQNKQKAMKAAKINGDVYNDIAQIAFGIFGTESNFADTHSAVGNLVRAIRKSNNPLSSSSPDYKSKYSTYGAKENFRSVGLTQIRWNYLSGDEKKALKSVGITSNADFMEPEKAALGTTIVLGVRYNQQLTDEEKKNIWNTLPKKWNKRKNYASRVLNNSKYLILEQKVTNKNSATKKDKWGRPSTSKWYGFNPQTKKYEFEIGGIIKSNSTKYFKNGGQKFIEADLDEEEIEEYRANGYIVEDISAPSLNKRKFASGGVTDLNPITMAKYLADLKVQENNEKKGFKNNKWYPHRSVEGGADTIGYGHKLTKADSKFYKGITTDEVEKLLQADVLIKQSEAKKRVDKKYGVGTFDALPQDSQMLVVDYQYNVGLQEFPKFLDALVKGDKETMLKEYERTSSSGKLTKRNNWAKSVIDNLNYNTDEVPIQSNIPLANVPDNTVVVPQVIPETIEEIEEYKKGGYIVEELDDYQDGGIYKVKGSSANYKKVNGKWQVDWNRSGKYQPLSKGDVKTRSANLDKYAKPVNDGMSKVSSNSFDNTRVNYQKPLVESFNRSNNLESFYKKEKEKDLQKQKDAAAYHDKTHKIIQKQSFGEFINQDVLGIVPYAEQLDRMANDRKLYKEELRKELKPYFDTKKELDQFIHDEEIKEFEFNMAGPHNNYNDGPVQMVYPEKYFIGPGGGMIGNTKNFVKNTYNLGKKILSNPYVSGAMNAYFIPQGINEFADPNSHTRKSMSRAYNNPSKSNIGDATYDVSMNLLNFIGLPYSKAIKASKPGINTVKNLINQTYKINPWAFKPNEANWYRQVGKSAIDDAVETGLVRETGEEVSPRMWREFQNQIKRLQGDDAILDYYERFRQQMLAGRRPNSPYFAKGDLFYPMDKKVTMTKSGKISKNPTAKGTADYLIETDLPNESFQPAYVKGMYLGVPEEIGSTAILKPNPELRNLENFNLYKKNWLQGYKRYPGYNLIVKKQGGYIDLELTPEEIEQYRRGGYVVEELY